MNKNRDDIDRDDDEASEIEPPQVCWGCGSIMPPQMDVCPNCRRVVAASERGEVPDRHKHKTSDRPANDRRNNEPPTVFDPWARYVVPEFPFDILPPLVQDFVGAEATVIGGDPSAMAMCVLGTFSGALHHDFKLKMMKLGDWTASPRLWILLRAQVSWKKTPMFKSATRPLVRYEAHKYGEHRHALRDYEKAKKQAREAGEKFEVEKPEPPAHYVVWDTTIEKLGENLTHGDRCKGALVLADEVAGWLGAMERYGNTGRTRADAANPVKRNNCALPVPGRYRVKQQ